VSEYSHSFFSNLTLTLTLFYSSKQL
jgi:hypothetical protein